MTAAKPRAGRRAAAGPRIPRGLETRAPGDLKAAEHNARTHSAAQVSALAASIAAYGFNAPILIARDGTVVAGHARLEAARVLNLERVPVVVLDHLSARERRAYLLADNRLAELAGWDRTMLAAELGDLQSGGVDLGTLGFSDQDLRALLDQDVPELDGRDEPVVAPERPVSRPGDLWLLDQHRLLCGDAADPRSWARLCEGDEDKAQCVFTDPPYGISYSDAKGQRLRNDDKRGAAFSDMLTRAFQAAGAHARDDAAWYIWHSDDAPGRKEFDRAMTAAGLIELHNIVWAKPSAALSRTHYQCAHELCYYASREGRQPAWYGGHDQATVWRFGLGRRESSAAVLGTGLELVSEDGRVWVAPHAPKNKRVRQLRVDAGHPVQVRVDRPQETLWEVSRDHAPDHPTQKPVELVCRALRNSTDVGDFVIDPFGGSGSTLLGAEELGRVARLTELEPRYVDGVPRRYHAVTGREPLLAGRPAKRARLEAVAAERASAKA